MADQNLFKQRCFACSIDTPPMEADVIKDLIVELEAGWKVVDNKKIEKSFRFKDFKGALEFVNLVDYLITAVTENDVKFRIIGFYEIPVFRLLIFFLSIKNRATFKLPLMFRQSLAVLVWT